METVKTEYIGGLRTKAIHVKSGVELITDAPTDNNGKGEFFSPTDMVATALGSCMLTVIGIVAERSEFSITGTKLNITKVMGTDPRRITEIIIEFNFPDNNYSDKEKEIIKHTALTCPVAKSLHPDLIQTLVFNF